MKLNIIGKILFALVASVLVWQSSFFLNTSAMAASSPLFANVGNKIENAADNVREGSKELIQDSKKNVKRTAERNASKVDEADDDGSVIERKAKRDESRIKQRAEEHSARTEKAVDDSMDGVKGFVENIKDAFGQ